MADAEEQLFTTSTLKSSDHEDGPVRTDDVVVNGQFVKDDDRDKIPGDSKSEVLSSSGQPATGSIVNDKGSPIVSEHGTVSPQIVESPGTEHRETETKVGETKSAESIEFKSGIDADISEHKGDTIVDADVKKKVNEDSVTEDIEVPDLKTGNTEAVSEGESKHENKETSDHYKLDKPVDDTKLESHKEKQREDGVEEKVVEDLDEKNESVLVDTHESIVKSENNTEASIEEEGEAGVPLSTLTTSVNKQEEEKSVTEPLHYSTTADSEAAADVILDGHVIAESRRLIKEEVSEIAIEKNTNSEIHVASLEGIQEQKVQNLTTVTKTDTVIEENSSITTSKSEQSDSECVETKIKELQQPIEEEQIEGNKANRESAKENEEPIAKGEKDDADLTTDNKKDTEKTNNFLDHLKPSDNPEPDTEAFKASEVTDKHKKEVDEQVETPKSDTMSVKVEVNAEGTAVDVDISGGENELPPLLPLTDEEIDAICSNYPNLTPKLRQTCLSFFWEVDQDGIGMFNIHQLAYWLRTHGYKMSDRDIAKMFVDLDLNNDMLVSLDEFLAEMTKQPPKPLTEETYKGLFKRFDQNGDGFVDRQDFTTTVNQLDIIVMPFDVDDFMACDSTGKAEKLMFKDFTFAFKRLLNK